MNYLSDINADNQFIRNDELHDLRPELQIIVKKFEDRVSIHTEDQDGHVEPYLLTAPENKDKIQETINFILKENPNAWISWSDPGITGVCFQIRYSTGRVSRFFRSDTNGAFYRRKTYANQNPGSTVSFLLFD